MRKLFILLSLSCALVSACTKSQLGDTPAKTKTYTINAIASNQSDTKTNLDSVTVKWSAGDEIAVFGKNSYTTKHVYHISGSGGSSSATFVSTDGCDESDIFALYPASEAVSHTAQFTKIVYGDSFVNQQYVRDGIQSNLMAMAAVGTPTALQFVPVNCVLRLNLKTTGPAKTISKIDVISTAMLASNSQYFDKNKWSTEHTAYYHDVKYAITYNVNEELGSDAVQYNIVTMSGSLTDLKFLIYATDGTVATLKKTSALATVNGKIYEFPETNLSFSVPVVQIQYDDSGTWLDWPSSGVLNIPNTSIALRTNGSSLVNAEHIASIKTAMSSATTKIDLDLSDAAYYMPNWKNDFARFSNIGDIKLPYNVTSVDSYAFLHSGVKKIFISAGVTSLGVMVISGANTSKFVVDENNPNYSSDSDGALYSKDKTTLIEASAAATGSRYTIPAFVTTLGANVFSYNTFVELTIPSTVTATIGTQMLYGCKYLDVINALSPTPLNVAFALTATNGIYASNRIINVPAGCKAAYEAAWSSFLTCEHPYTFVQPSSNQVNASIPNLNEE